MSKLKTFADYKQDAANWITLASGEYYPDILGPACKLYAPVLEMFGQLLERSESSISFFMNIAAIPEPWMRVQAARVFRKYVSPETPVEMLRRKTKAKEICDTFGYRFRKIPDVQAAFKERPIPDEALCALLWEYKSRGQKGYDLTQKFFQMFREQFPTLKLEGPERAGKDIMLAKILKGYAGERPVDFVVSDEHHRVLAIGLARYDSDRGGAQEDDRTGGYKNAATEILTFALAQKLSIKVIFVNDGPGLLLGSMWDDYATLESSDPGKILVTTLRMIPDRLTVDWLRS